MHKLQRECKSYTGGQRPVPLSPYQISQNERPESDGRDESDLQGKGTAQRLFDPGALSAKLGKKNRIRHGRAPVLIEGERPGFHSASFAFASRLVPAGTPARDAPPAP